MSTLSALHVDNCSREISRWSKAVRLIHALERFLPDSFPEPDSIIPGKKPFDLKVTWTASGAPHRCYKLRNRISKALEIENKWQPDINGNLTLQTRVRIGIKTTMYLHLVIEKGKQYGAQ